VILGLPALVELGMTIDVVNSCLVDQRGRSVLCPLAKNVAPNCKVVDNSDENDLLVKNQLVITLKKVIMEINLT